MRKLNSSEKQSALTAAGGAEALVSRQAGVVAEADAEDDRVGSVRTIQTRRKRYAVHHVVCEHDTTQTRRAVSRRRIQMNIKAGLSAVRVVLASGCTVVGEGLTVEPIHLKAEDHSALRRARQLIAIPQPRPFQRPMLFAATSASDDRWLADRCWTHVRAIDRVAPRVGGVGCQPAGVEAPGAVEAEGLAAGAGDQRRLPLVPVVAQHNHTITQPDQATSDQASEGESYVSRPCSSVPITGSVCAAPYLWQT